jgi:hypothetical protein
VNWDCRPTADKSQAAKLERVAGPLPQKRKNATDSR